MKTPLRFGWIVPALYVGFIAVPIVWLARTSLAPTAAAKLTLDNYAALFAPGGWSEAFGMGLLEAGIGAVIAVIAALPAAYALARYRFLGDRPLFFWLFAGRMLPAAALAGPVGGFYASLNMLDTPIAVALAHGMFNVGVAVWILEAAVRNIPRRIDETAEMDGYAFAGFFLDILLPLIIRAVVISAAVCFAFSWTETAIASVLTASGARPIGPRIVEAVLLPGADKGVLAAAAMLSLLPGVVLAWFIRRHIACGMAMGRG
jgi:glycerol transport system permease protein